MPRFRFGWLAAVVLSAVGMAALAAPAQAQFRMRLENVTLGQGVTVTDNGAGDLNPLVGAITVTTALPGGFVVNVTTGVSKPLIGGVTNFAELDLNSVNVNAGGPGELRISLEDTGYTNGANQSLILFGRVGGVLTAPGGSTATFRSWANGGNLVPAYGVNVGPAPGPLAALGAIPAGSVEVFGGGAGITFGPGAFSATNSVGFTAGPQYSMFAQANIVFTGPGSVSFNDNQETLPAPGGLALALVALPGFGLAYLRRRFLRS